ncbi:transcription antitermination factor NusB [Amphibacillus xylanus]|uniref:Transcription antitermination protein NusB n=1 Tax=Amphibacillus xylanus (strain ATCC 51415 / DSM 6626 / JCM 7361 / LMG 17667 / NBRC 15112 / Ep01) TaxID=698758 RepID=K0J3X7_AMPXN|nr:transcription antitermination factor NusB [Amphibacillus xylanus]BAM47306.1 N utilization substance protein B homolog [Amphibacillus xylanus NBRC 15112]
MNRRLGREKAFQVLFSLDNEDFDVDSAIEHILEEEPNEFVRTLIYGVVREKESIDKKITEHLENWTLDRLAYVEKALLRMAVFEMFSDLDTPKGVVINEVIEVAHIYGDEKSGQFINGVLAKINK